MKFLRVFANLYLLHQTLATPTQSPTPTTAADIYDWHPCTSPTSVLGSYQTPVYSAGLFTPPDGRPRIQPKCPDSVKNWEIEDLLRKVPNHLMGTLAWAPAFMPALYDLFRGVIQSEERKLPLHDAVVVILRTAWKLKCEYIFKNWLHLHVLVQKNLKDLHGGFKQETDLSGLADIFTMSAEGIADGDGPYDLRQRALIKMVDEQVDNNKTIFNSTMVDLKTYNVTAEQVVEALIMHGLIGTYCSVLKGLRVEIDPDYSVASMVDAHVKLLPEDSRDGLTI